MVERAISSIDLHSSVVIEVGFSMSNGFDLSSNDKHILNHLLPQGKNFANEFLNLNSVSDVEAMFPF